MSNSQRQRQENIKQSSATARSINQSTTAARNVKQSAASNDKNDNQSAATNGARNVKQSAATTTNANQPASATTTKNLMQSSEVAKYQTVSNNGKKCQTDNQQQRQEMLKYNKIITIATA